MALVTSSEALASTFVANVPDPRQKLRSVNGGELHQTRWLGRLLRNASKSMARTRIIRI